MTPKGNAPTQLYYTSFIRLFHLTVVSAYSILILTIILVPYRFPSLLTKNHIIEHGWKYRNFLFSIWATAAQYAYFFMFLAIDALEIHGGPVALKIRNQLQNIASYFLFSFVFPLSAHVFILFWCFYAWDREYIYPEALDSVVPFWLNHVFHTFPPLLSVIYMLTCNEKEPSMKATFSGLTVLLAAYSVIFFYVKIVHGVWVYQAFEVLQGTAGKFLLIWCGFGSIPFLFLGHKINRYITDLKQNGIKLFNMAAKNKLIHEKNN